MNETAETTKAEAYKPRLKVLYEQQVVQRLMQRFDQKNKMAVPRLEKVVLNMGIGEAVGNANVMEDALETMREIAGQQPVTTRARRSIAGFRVRQGMPLGCKVTLRGRRMYEFLDRLISMVLPRVRDFRGLPVDAFDGSGNYNLGIEDCAVFPELDLDKIKTIFGMDITIVTTARSDQEGFELLSMLGVPFRQ
jgi:large subunit ribosomal protein L5